MKRVLTLLAVVMLVVALCVPAMAATEAPQITMQPQNYQYPEYSVAMYSVKAEGTNLQATWYLAYEGKTYNLSDNTNGIEPWEGYAGENYGPFQEEDIFGWFFGGIEEGLNGAEIWCVIEDGHYDVTSARAIITVQGEAMPPEILDMPAALSAEHEAGAELRCVAKSNTEAQLAFQWYETTSGKLQDIRALDGEDSDYLLCDTNILGVRYYVCCVTDTDGGRAYSSVVPVTVTAATQAPATEPTVEAIAPTTPDTQPEETTAEPTAQPSEETTPQNPGDDGEGTPWYVIAAVGVAAAAIGAGAAALVLKKKK